MVSELKAYKAKPMKQVIPTEYGFALKNDRSTESDDCPPNKRIKLEPVGLKQEPACVMEESKSDTSWGGLPALLCHSSSLCRFVPLSAMLSSNSADMDLSECRIVDILADDISSHSSLDDGSNSELAAAVDSSHVTGEVNNGIVKSVTNSVDSVMSCRQELFKTVEEKSLLETSSTFVQQSDEQELTEVTELKVQTENSRASSVAHCSMEQHGSSQMNSKHARHIRYLESLLAV